MPPSMNEEIEAALTEFNKREEEYNAQKVVKQEHKSSGMAAFLVRNSGGMIPNERAANYVLLIISLLMLLFSMFALVNRNGMDRNQVPQAFIGKEHLLQQ